MQRLTLEEIRLLLESATAAFLASSYYLLHDFTRKNETEKEIQKCSQTPLDDIILLEF